MTKQLLNFAAAGALALAGGAMPQAQAQCGRPVTPIKPMAFHAMQAQPRLLAASLNEKENEGPSIVGMWIVTFTANTMNGKAIPDTVVDKAVVVWHRDGTEIMNSGRPPQDGNFCLGVWEETGRGTYKLNHFAWGANNYAPGTAEGLVGPPIGPVHYREQVTVGPLGMHYHGTFSLDLYDTSGNVELSFTGALKATRITIDTTTDELLQAK